MIRTSPGVSEEFHTVIRCPRENSGECSRQESGWCYPHRSADAVRGTMLFPGEDLDGRGRADAHMEEWMPRKDTG